jgi:L-arabinose isomerase
VIVLDTTPIFAFSRNGAANELMYNHGIHGVQDLCNVLRQSGKHYMIEAGHWRHSDVVERICRRVERLRSGQIMRNTRVGLIGEPFPGMGDIRVTRRALENDLGLIVVQAPARELLRYTPGSDCPSVQREIDADREIFGCGVESPDLHRESIRVGLGLRGWIEENRLDAFTMNALSFGSLDRQGPIPFLEASKAMARGIGYSGEGDVLAAALSAICLRRFGDATFTEMFCPDWENNRILLSHTAEFNHRLAAEKPTLIAKPYPLLGVSSVVAVGALRCGVATLVNLATFGNHESRRYQLIVIPGKIAAEKSTAMGQVIRAWFEPRMSLQDFLPRYSYLGGTHHVVLVYGDEAEELRRIGEDSNWDVYRLGC